MPSHAVDNDCYWRAVRAVFGAPDDTPALHGFQNVTDNGILDEWVDLQFGRAPSTPERTAVKAQFFRELETAAASAPEAFTPLPGCEDWLAVQAAGSVAIATGGWEHSARFKLRIAALEHFDLPLASADQGGDRTAIMQHALSLLIDAPVGTANRPSLTYLGDGPWDFAAAQALGWRFIGIASGERADRLRTAGAEQVFPDFHPLLQQHGLR